jgi:hypothetical protein
MSSLFPKPFFLILSFILLFSLSLLGEARGGPFKLTPSLNLREEYNDNIFFSINNRENDFITTVSPAIDLVNRTERVDLNFNGRLDILRYGSNEGLNDENYYFRGKVRYSFNPKLAVSGEGGFTRDFTPDQDIDISGLVVMGAVRRYRQNYASGADYVFSEKTRANFSYSYDRSDFKEREFIDTRAHDASLGFLHDLSQILSSTMGRMNFGYGRYLFQGSTVDYYSATIGISRALSEKWTILVDAGANYTRSDFETGTLIVKQEKEEDWGGVGLATLSYRGEKTGGELGFTHRVMPAVGRSGAAERTSLTLTMRHRFTHEFSGRLSAGYHINKSKTGAFSTTPIDEATFVIHPVLRYEFSKNIAIEASYRYGLVKYRQENTEARRSLLMLNLTIQYPLFE